MWHPTARLRWVWFSSRTLQQLWIRMDSNPEIAEGVPYEGAREWRDVPIEEASDD
jgi:hypothetical protein